MIYPYVVVLKNRQSRYLDLLGFLLAFISLLFFIRELLEPGAPRFIYLLGALFIAGVLAWNVFQSLYRHKKVYYSRALLIAALVWMKMPYLEWLAITFIILALLEYQAKYSVEIGFSEQEIVINTLFKKRYQWKDVTNVILKDGLLTLDLASNRLLQREIEDEEESEADEEEFNAFCRQQLNRVHSHHAI